jgi:hypothetical protein
MTFLKRSRKDRRSGKERRKVISLKHFRFKIKNRRRLQDRRKTPERREGWVRLSKWSSINLSQLKIAKYLKLPK